MKKIALYAAIISVPIFLGASCSILDQNINARKNLANCKYELQKVVPTGIKLDGLKLKSVDFDFYLKITNTAKSDVALDRIEADIYLDDNKVANASHKQFVRIKPSKSATEIFSSEVPFASIIKAIGKKPKDIIIVAKVYVSLLIGEHTIKTNYSITVKQKFPIPYKKINKLIKEEAKKAVKSLKGKSKKELRDELKKKFKF